MPADIYAFDLLNLARCRRVADDCPMGVLLVSYALPGGLHELFARWLYMLTYTQRIHLPAGCWSCGCYVAEHHVTVHHSSCRDAKGHPAITLLIYVLYAVTPWQTASRLLDITPRILLSVSVAELVLKTTNRTVQNHAHVTGATTV